MTRTLTFNGADGQDRFDKIWEGFLFGTRAEQGRRQGAPDREIQRRRAGLGKKLKGISVETKRVIAGVVTYRDVAADAILSLTQPEHDLLVKTMEETDWLPEHLDDAYAVIDWVSAADKVS